jgi:hypothetical protein
MLALALIVTSIAVADSLNPSTVVPALWLASAPHGRGLGSFTAGVFAVYLAGGLVLVLGPGPALIRDLHHVGGPIEHALQAAGGAVALAFAFALWRGRRNEPTEQRPRRCSTRASAFALGAGIMALELPTAFVYFGAISAILTAHRVAAVEISLLVVYNTLFVLPLLAILAVRRLSAEHAERWLEAAGEWVRRAGRLAVAGLAGTAGAVLVVIGVGGLLAA